MPEPARRLKFGDEDFVKMVLDNYTDYTGTTALTPAFSVGINGVLVSRSPFVGLSTPASQALCWAVTGTGPLNAIVYYGQF
jgi:hypothetical protein